MHCAGWRDGPRIVPAGPARGGNACAVGCARPITLTTIADYEKEMAKISTAPAPTAVPASYEAALAELEGLVTAMEAGQMPLDRLLDAYRRGAELLTFCRSRLEAVEQQVKILEDGQLKPWAPA